MRKVMFIIVVGVCVACLLAWLKNRASDAETATIASGNVTPQSLPVEFTYQPIEVPASPEPEPPSTRVSGRVLQPDGQPIPDAQLEVLFPREPGESGLSERDVIGETSSDELGAYRLPDLPVGKILTVVVTHPDWAMGGGQLLALSQNEKRDEIDFVLHPAVSVSGFVVSEEDTPISGATVFLLDLSESPGGNQGDSASTRDKRRTVYALGSLGDSSYLMKTETDAAGSFRLQNIPDGFILGNLGAEKEGYAPGWAVSPESENRRETTGDAWWNARRITLPAENIRIVLREAGLVTGKVVQANTSEPVAEAKVYIEGLTELLGPFSDAFARYDENVSADASGYFKFENVPPGDVNVYAAKEGATSSAVRITVARGYANDEILLQLVRDGAIAGHVYDAETGAPIGGMLLNYKQRGIGSPLLVARAHTDGSYRIDQLTAGVVDVGPRAGPPYKLSKTHHPEALTDSIWYHLEVPVEPGMLTEGIDLYCEPNKQFASIVRGKVLDISGRPAIGANVTIRGRSVSRTTDGSGEYVLSTEISGNCTILATDRLETTYGMKEVTAEFGKETRADIRLGSSTSKISGSIVHQDGRPATVSVQIIPVEDGDTPNAVSTGTDGVFETVLFPGRYAISPAAENAAFKPTPAQYDIRLGGGEVVTDLDFVLEPVDGFVAGIVYYANGEPASSLTVTAAGNGTGARCVTDASGKFFLHPVVGESLMVKVQIPQNPTIAWATVSPVSEGQDDLSIILEELGTLRAAITLPHQQSANVVIVATYPESRVVASQRLAEGEMELSLPEGEYSLRFRAGENEILLDTAIESDRVTELGEVRLDQ